MPESKCGITVVECDSHPQPVQNISIFRCFFVVLIEEKKKIFFFWSLTSFFSIEMQQHANVALVHSDLDTFIFFHKHNKVNNYLKNLFFLSAIFVEVMNSKKKKHFTNAGVFKGGPF